MSVEVVSIIPLCPSLAVGPEADLCFRARNRVTCTVEETSVARSRLSLGGGEIEI